MNDFYIGYWKETFFFVHPIGKMLCYGEFCHKICFEMSKYTGENYIQISPAEYADLVFAGRVKNFWGQVVYPNGQYA